MKYRYENLKNLRLIKCAKQIHNFRIKSSSKGWIYQVGWTYHSGAQKLANELWLSHIGLLTGQLIKHKV